MLPKVATQLIHHTTRAVAAVQGSGYAFRNAFQSSSSGPTTTVNWPGVGASGSSWGSAGTGAGGAKYQSSSKFYHGYQGAGRTLTQASQASAVDSGLNQSDDTEDPFLRPAPTKTSSARPFTNVRRPRSHSLILGSEGQVENTKSNNSPGVLEVVRIHARASHAFAPHNSAVDETVASPLPLEPRPKLSRRASTSSLTSSPPSDDALSPSFPFEPQPISSLDPDPLALQSAASPAEDSVAQIRAKLAEYSSGKGGSACTYLNQLLQDGQLPQDATVYEAAIQAVADTYKNKSDVSLLTQLFDGMVRLHLPPSAEAYRSLILVHLAHDFEVEKAVRRHSQNIHGRQVQNKVLQRKFDPDVRGISKLEPRSNFRTAFRIFRAAKKTNVEISHDVYANLLRACIRHLDEYAALRVFAHLEREHASCVPLSAYLDMMELYAKKRDLAAVEETFSGFRNAAQLGKVSYDPIPISGVPPPSRVDPWNQMIQMYLRTGRQAEAVAILETMFESPDPSVPRPSSSTFHSLLSGFCSENDMETALKWFRRLLQETTVAEDASSSLPGPPRPDATLWHIVIGALAKRGMVDDANSLYSQWLSGNAQDSPSVISTARRLLTWANIAHLEALQTKKNASPGEVQSKLDHVVEKILGDPHGWILPMDESASDVMSRIVRLYARDGRFNEAIGFLKTYLIAHQAVTGTLQGGEGASIGRRLIYAMRDRVSAVTEWIFKQPVPPPFVTTKAFVSIANSVDRNLSAGAAEIYLSIYEDSKKSGQIDDFTVSDAETLISAGVCVIYTNNGHLDDRPESHPLVRFETLLTDIAERLLDLSTLSPTAIDGVLRGLGAWYPVESLRAVLEKLGAPWLALWDQPLVQEQVSLIATSPPPTPKNDVTVEVSQPSTPSSVTAVATYRISHSLSQKIEGCLVDYKNPLPFKAYQIFTVGYSNGFCPTVETLGKLINALGRAGDIEKANFAYEAAQHAISMTTPARGGDPNAPWYLIEDHMIIALAHAGDVDAAHTHRLRILESGGTPSADAYGALISCVKDTTDDSANAYSLYRESQIRGVFPNVYLYNTMISKLSKARKADLAMELFSKMKEIGFLPSSVTYGAVIGACSRVGDVESAEALFEEMSSRPNFKPRIPPFNTMMQLYTYTRRNRDKVLHYYDSMVAAGVRPTAHTYKLLMDAYGTIEPVDIAAMEQTFATLCASSPRVLGTHWASLINAYGCVQKDLDRAVEVFESIASHHSTRGGNHMPDAIAYEALINVFITLRRTDLIPVYMDRFQSSGQHMTAYIANLLIKGYAVAGELEKARNVFASLVDPPTGVAAPNNHAPHELDAVAPVHPNAPVYREPSTWEAMVRAELGNGNREEAVVLLERMRARQFPAAVYARISGIMLDGSASPWPEPTSPTPEQE